MHPQKWYPSQTRSGYSQITAEETACTVALPVPDGFGTNSPTPADDWQDRGGADGRHPSGFEYSDKKNIPPAVSAHNASAAGKPAFAGTRQKQPEK